MDLRVDLRYAADPVTVMAMLAEEEFQSRVAVATGALSHEATTTVDGETVSTRLRRVLPPMVPDYARRFVGDTLDVEQTIDWAPARPDGSRAGRVTVVIARVPVQMQGSTLLAPHAQGSRQVVDCQVRASVPFIGGKIERAAADAVRAAARKQEEVAADWLSGR